MNKLSSLGGGWRFKLRCCGTNVYEQVWYIYFIYCLLFALDAYSTLNMVVVPAIEHFTLASKVPKGKSVHTLPTEPSRLEYQTRTNVVYVQTNRKPFVDEKKRVRFHQLLEINYF